MHYAAEQGSLTVILAMISRGAVVDPTDFFLRTPLMVAIETHRSAVARTLIEMGAEVDLIDTFGKSPLMYACKAGNLETVELLLKCKANIH